MMKRDVKSGSIYSFDNILDFVEYVSSGNLKDRWSMDDSSKRCNFAGGTWKDAVEQATTGNPQLVKNFFDGVNVISAMIEEEKIGEIRDVVGEYFDVADFLSGEPEVFRRDEYGDRKPVVPVYANFAMHCGISNTVIRNRGCGIIALCDELSKSGFIVDLHLVQASYYHKKFYTDIKVGLDPLDLDTAAFIIANPLCHRRLWFALLENATGKSFCGGYGTPDEYDLDDIFSTGVSGFYFTSSNHSNFEEDRFYTEESTKEHIVKMIEKFKESAEQVILG